MVRIKNRYLLLDILYPDPSTWPKPAQPQPQPPNQNQNKAQLQIHTPTPDTLTPGLLAKLVREKVAEIYGDWGVGRLGVGVSG